MISLSFPDDILGQSTEGFVLRLSRQMTNPARHIAYKLKLQFHYAQTRTGFALNVFRLRDNRSTSNSFLFALHILY